jgi:hypothetical protein
MLKAAITAPLTKQEVRALMQFLSHHLGYVPVKNPTVVFAKTAKEYADLYENWKIRIKDLTDKQIDEINSDTPAYFDHLTDTVVFQAFSYADGKEIETFVITMSTVLHELIHFFQYATGTFGSYRTIYEGTNEILSCMLADDPSIDYKYEAQCAMSLAMEINGHDLMSAIQWMKTCTIHSDKNEFVHRSIAQCPTLSRYNPRKLLLVLDEGKIAKLGNEATRTILTKYSPRRVVKLCRQGFKIINGII